ncbi:doxx family protein [Sediminicola sp. 1XM1-17]|uniref:doxx family protein n=1 Tax=Sediminicola sp. 1XM1-17 TaxID=3127702 RepID=UPI003077BB7E
MRAIYLHITNKISKEQILAISIGMVYIWFGSLKFFSALSPAEDLAIHTIARITHNLVPSSIAIFALAFWEVLIGLLLISNLYRRTIISMALIHMGMTFTPFLFFPELTFNNSIFVPTLLGQYIVKNIVIIGALLSLMPEKNETIGR